MFIPVSKYAYGNKLITGSYVVSIFLQCFQQEFFQKNAFKTHNLHCLKQAKCEDVCTYCVWHGHPQFRNNKM